MENLQQYHPIPQPDEIRPREREDAMGAYLMMFASLAAGLPLPIINLIASLVYHLANRKKGRFVRFHSLQSLLSQLPLTVMNAVAMIWTISIFFNPVISTEPGEPMDPVSITEAYWAYIIVVGLTNLAYFIFSLVAASKAKKGRFYYFLFFGRLAYHLIYRIKPEERHSEAVQPTNRPPSA